MIHDEIIPHYRILVGIFDCFEDGVLPRLFGQLLAMEKPAHSALSVGRGEDSASDFGRPSKVIFVFESVFDSIQNFRWS